MDRQHGIDFIRHFRGDGEFAKNNMLKKFFEENGIVTEFTQRNSPFQNGKNERFHQTVMDMARSMLIDSNLPSNFWEEAVKYSVYILNRISSNSDPARRSGYERRYKEKPNLSLIRRFGEICFRKLPDSKKQDPKGHECRLVGIDETRKEVYFVYDLVDRTIVPSRDITFPAHSQSDPELSFPGEVIIPSAVETPTHTKESSNSIPAQDVQLEAAKNPSDSLKK
jgi:hypothetical protein